MRINNLFCVGHPGVTEKAREKKKNKRKNKKSRRRTRRKKNREIRKEKDMTIWFSVFKLFP